MRQPQACNVRRFQVVPPLMASLDPEYVLSATGQLRDYITCIRLCRGTARSVNPIALALTVPPYSGRLLDRYSGATLWRQGP
jgi:hypothetical protein